MLFYDPILSRDSTASCGLCHKSYGAFSDPTHPIAHGRDHLAGTRNAPPNFNTLWQKEFFWDGGINHIEVLSLAPITNPVEMDAKLPDVIKKLNKSTFYKPKFQEVFQKDTVNSEQMLKALAQFMSTIVSGNSRFDKYQRNEGEQLTATELAGKALVEQKCAPCHSTVFFTDQSYRNNGLDTETSATDIGRMKITSQASDKHKFRVPTLRNLQYTLPYMHDGRLATLKDVLDHYADSVKFSPTLDPLLQKNGRLGISLTETEKTEIIAFLQTLNDRDMVRNRNFTSPF
jgi:cytochrome c peroxidase